MRDGIFKGVDVNTRSSLIYVNRHADELLFILGLGEERNRRRHRGSWLVEALLDAKKLACLNFCHRRPSFYGSFLMSL